MWWSSRHPLQTQHQEEQQTEVKTRNEGLLKLKIAFCISGDSIIFDFFFTYYTPMNLFQKNNKMDESKEAELIM